MLDTGPEHPVTYRSEAAGPFFHKYVKSSESCVLVGLPGSGLQRFIDFVLRPDVQMHYLGAQFASYADAPLLLKVNCKRITERSEWGLSELLLTTLVEGCNLRPQTVSLQPELKDLRVDVVLHKNDLLAQRHLEQAVATFIQRANFRLYFLLSEFDELYKNLPDLALDHLRALRDQHKYAVNYALGLHQYPEQLRPDTNDQLSAWMGHNVITVGHYAGEDARRMLDQLEARKGSRLPAQARADLLSLSGCHAGLLSGLYSHLAALPQVPDAAAWEEWLQDTGPAPSPVLAECRSLWEGLTGEERQCLIQVEFGASQITEKVRRLLESKQLITTSAGRMALFSPLFARFVRLYGQQSAERLCVNEELRTVTIGTRVITKFSKRVFKLLVYLYNNKGKVCSKDDIMKEVYDGEKAVNTDMALANLLKRARQDLQVQNPEHYLITVHGVGLRLVEYPQAKNTAPVSESVQ